MSAEVALLILMIIACGGLLGVNLWLRQKWKVKP